MYIKSKNIDVGTSKIKPENPLSDSDKSGTP